MRVTLAVLADHANVTQDGKLNIIGIFQEVNPPFLPFPLPQIFLVATFEAEPPDYGREQSIRVALRAKNGGDSEMLALEGQALVPQPTRPGGPVYLNQALGLSGVTFERAGDYEFSISVEGEEKATVPLRVNKVRRDLAGGPDG